MIQKLLRYSTELGPAWLVTAIAAGPGTMASVMGAGAAFGFKLLWVVLLSACLAAAAQFLAAELGLKHSGKGIVALTQETLGSAWAWLLVLVTVLAAGLAQFVIMRSLAGVSELITGLDARLWAVVWALLLAFCLALGGYRVVEWVAKALVAVIVLAFIAVLFLVPLEPSAVARGLLPSLPAERSSILMAAGILGGAVHITLLTMQSYTMRARGWTPRQRGLARFDILSSLMLALGTYSTAIFLVAAATLHTPTRASEALDAVTAAAALQPLVGPYAGGLFLFGLWGAAFSTLGGNSVVPAYLISDKLGWDYLEQKGRFRLMVAAFAASSALGMFLGDAFFQLLVLMLAFSLAGTVFALLLILFLLNTHAEPPAHWLNLAGGVLVAITALLSGAFVVGRIPTAFTNAFDGFAVGFAAVMLVACTRLGFKFVLHLRRRRTHAQTAL